MKNKRKNLNCHLDRSEHRGVRLILLIALMVTVPVFADQTNIIYGYSTDIGLRPNGTNVKARATLLYPNPRVVNNFTVRQDPIEWTVATNGYYGFTNLQWGRYQLLLSGVGTPFTFWVQTNTSGSVPIGSLITNLTANPPNPASNYYTMGQMDALLGTGSGQRPVLADNDEYTVEWPSLFWPSNAPAVYDALTNAGYEFGSGGGDVGGKLDITNGVALGLSVSNSAFNLLNGDGAAFGLRHLEDYLNLSAEGVSWQFDTFGDDAGTLRGTMFDASTSMTLNGVTITEWPGASDMTSKLNTVNGHATNLTSVDLLVTNVLGVVFTNDSSGIVAYNASLVPVFYVNNAGTTTSSNFTALDGVTIGGVKRTTWPTSGGPLGMLTNGTYYVSAAEGDDDTGDGTINNPWFTPTNAIAQVTSGLIVVDGGQYQFTITGKNNVHWQLATDCIIGSSNVIAGPTFTATNGVAFSVMGGSVLATNQSFRTTGSGTIHMVSSRVYPPVVFTNSITGYWTE